MGSDNIGEKDKDINVQVSVGVTSLLDSKNDCHVA